MTVTSLKNLAEKVNKNFFQGELNVDALQFKVSNRMTKCRSQFEVGYNHPPTIKISALISVDQNEVYKTLVHEMIHYYQWTEGMDLGHGYSFKIMAMRINSIDPSLEVARTNKSQNQAVQQSIVQKRKASIQSQYAIFYVYCGRIRVNFLKNISLQDIEYLKSKSFIYSIKKVVDPDPRFRANRNIASFLKTKYYYEVKQTQHLEMEEVYGGGLIELDQS